VAGEASIYEFINGVLKLLRERPQARPGVLAGSSATAVASAVMAAWILLGTPHDYSVWVVVPIVIGVLALLVVISAVLSYAGVVQVGSISSELQTAEDNRKEVQEKVKSEPQNPYAHIELGAAELRVFYAINQGQARSSFRFGVITVLAGLAFLLVGVVLFFAQQGLAPAALSAIGGVIAEFIGGTSLYLYNRVQAQSSYYHDYLGQYQRLMLAVSLCNDIEDGRLRDSTLKELALEIAKASTTTPSATGSGLHVLPRGTSASSSVAD
jgi:hypothetical protein